jgi:hypothetical protein
MATKLKLHRVTEDAARIANDLEILLSSIRTMSRLHSSMSETAERDNRSALMYAVEQLSLVDVGRAGAE